MRLISQSEMKEIELKVLDSIDKICDQYNLRYSLAYGTLIGAVRHKGFIPWDDDIDIIMPREDYERFIIICDKMDDTPFKLLSLHNDNTYNIPFAKASYKGTVIIEKNTVTTKQQLGVYVDVFPIDVLGSTYEEALKFYKKLRLEKYIYETSIWKRFFRSKRKAWYFEPIRFIAFFLSRFVNSRKAAIHLEGRIKNHRCSNPRFGGNLFTMYGSREICELPVFTSDLKMDFENRKYRVIQNYDEVLTSIYGNYMELPPVSKRVTHHDFEAFWIE